LTKRLRYYYDAEAILEDAVPGLGGGRQRAAADGSYKYSGAEYKSSMGDPDRNSGLYAPPARGRGGATAFRGQGQERPEGNGRANREGRDMRDVGIPRGARKLDGSGTGGDASGIRDHSGNSLNRPDGKRNKRSVWTVTTQGFREAHFATFPPDLVRPMILAGCPEGGTGLDPFSGAGTVSLVAESLGRNSIGIELNPKYVKMARRRTSQVGF
jgi:site-specific DNA-methyltransferase (adenine-specific)